PEDEIVADDDMRRLDALAQDLDDEGLGAAPGHRAVEGEQIEVIDSHRLQMAQLDAKGRKPEGRAIRLEEGARMRLEGEHGARRLEFARKAQGLADHLLMAQMKTVEIAQRHHGAARFHGDLRMMPE